jgi:tetratricopeptide (TPR) repeat protein
MLAVFLISLMIFPGCRALLRYPAQVGPAKDSAGEDFVTNLNPYILTNLISNHLVVELDYVEGCRPSPKALTALERRLRKYCPADKEIRVLLDDEIQLEDWENLGRGRQAVERFVRYNLDHDPRDWEEVEVVYVLYSPRSGPWFGGNYFGLTTQVTFEREAQPATVDMVNVFAEAVGEHAILWVGPARVERSTLVHEFGHVLGLVSNRVHTQRGNPQHCTEPQCVMTHPRLRSILYNLVPGFFAGRIPNDYCSKCRADIRATQEAWAKQVQTNPEAATALRKQRTAVEIGAAARWFSDQKRFQDGVDYLSEFVLLDHELYGARYWMAWLLRRSGRGEEALSVLEEATARQPGAMLFAQIKAETLCELGRYDEALNAIDRKALEAEASFAGYRVLTHSLHGLGRHREAVEAWKELASSFNSFKNAQRQYAEWEMAQSYRRADSPAEALEILNVLWEHSPSNYGLGIELAQTMQELNRGEEAKAILEKVSIELEKDLSDNGHRSQILQALSRSSAILGDADKARRAVSMLKSFYEEEQSWIMLFDARIHTLLGDYPGALEALRKAGELDPITATDVCFELDFRSLRREQAFKKQFPQCEGPEQLGAR